MSGNRQVRLAARSVVSIGGEDTGTFLQGLISNDIGKVSERRAIYAALLSPQGKFLHDFFIVGHGGRLLFDVEAERRDDLIRRLTMYRLRAKVDIADEHDRFRVHALFGDDDGSGGAAAALGLDGTPGAAAALGGGVAYVDPRLADLGVRAMLPAAEAETLLADAGFTAAAGHDYERLRLTLGVPDGSRDVPADRGFLLEANFEELNGVDFEKGCYVGQELTARTKHRATIRKRLFRIDIDGPLPAPGTPVMLGDKEAGTVRSGLDGVALALLRLEDVVQATATGTPLTAGAARVKPVKPDWVNF